MIEIAYIQGDATHPTSVGPRIICHVCNDSGKWGKGFVLAISRRWPEPEAAYRQWHQEKGHNDFGLGAVQMVDVEPGLWVANMVAQHGVLPIGAKFPIRYDALRQCLGSLHELALSKSASVHMPRIGCGLAGGTWSEVEPLVVELLCHRDIPVTVYDLPIASE